MGEIEAGIEASKFVEKLYFENKIEEIDLETYLVKFVADNLVELIEEDINLVDFNTKALLEHFALIQNNYTLYITNFSKFVDTLFKNRLDDSKLKTAQYKKTILPSLLFDVDNYTKITKTKRINGKTKRVTKVDVRDLYYKYLTITKTIELPDQTIKFASLEDLATQINLILHDKLETNESTNDIKETLKLWGLDRVLVFKFDEKQKFVSVLYTPTHNTQSVPF